MSQQSQLPLSERAWGVAIALLCTPTIVFAALIVGCRPGHLPEFVDVLVAWAITLSGAFGSGALLGAFAMVIAATFQPNLSRNTKICFWIALTLSFLCFWCTAGIAQSQ
jgi:hypothetical protein